MHPHGATILLVEDSPDDLELSLLALDRAGAGSRVDVARDGVEALDYLFCTGAHTARDPGAQPRVILLDVKLPRLNGIEVLRRIRTDPRTHHLPVVMLTSSAEDLDVRTCYDLGVNSYVVKPVDIDRFFRVIGDLASYWVRLNRAGLPAA